MSKANGWVTQRVSAVHLARQVQQVQLVPPALTVHKAQQVKQVRQVPQALTVHKVQQARQGSKVNVAHKAWKAPKGREGLKVSKVSPVLVVQPENRGPPAPGALMASKVRVGQQALMVMTVLPA